MGGRKERLEGLSAGNWQREKADQTPEGRSVDEFGTWEFCCMLYFQLRIWHLQWSVIIWLILLILWATKVCNRTVKDTFTSVWKVWVLKMVKGTELWKGTLIVYAKCENPSLCKLSHLIVDTVISTSSICMSFALNYFKLFNLYKHLWWEWLVITNKEMEAQRSEEIFLESHWPLKERKKLNSESTADKVKCLVPATQLPTASPPGE